MGKNIISKLEIDTLVSKFDNKTLPKSEWTHEAHLIIGIWHLFRFDFEIAAILIKSKIKSYNTSIGTHNTEDAGYHETLTIFWIINLKNYITQNSVYTIEKIVNSFLVNRKSNKNITQEYYSKEILFSKQARKTWVNGDLKQIKLQKT